MVSITEVVWRSRHYRGASPTSIRGQSRLHYQIGTERDGFYWKRRQGRKNGDRGAEGSSVLRRSAIPSRVPIKGPQAEPTILGLCGRECWIARPGPKKVDECGRYGERTK